MELEISGLQADLDLMRTTLVRVHKYFNKNSRSYSQFFLIAAACFLLNACSESSPAKFSQIKSGPQTQQGVAPPITPVTPPLPAAVYEPLAWEKAATWTKSWSDFLFQTITTKGQVLIAGAGDVTNFCPTYANLTTTQKVNFWGMLISAMSKYESAFDPLSRMQETTMGKDPITGLPVYSEGLMQLSYQDIQWMPKCQFDWAADSNLSPTDSRKTILDPYKNLDCAVQILADQVNRHNVIAAPSRYAYWAVLIPGGKYTQLSQIQNITKTLTFCK